MWLNMDVPPVTFWRKRWKSSSYHLYCAVNFIRISALAALDGYSRLEANLPFLTLV